MPRDLESMQVFLRLMGGTEETITPVPLDDWTEGRLEFRVFVGQATSTEVDAIRALHNFVRSTTPDDRPDGQVLPFKPRSQ